MSRIGKLPIEIKEGVNVSLETDKLKISGPKGELELKIVPDIKVNVKENLIIVLPKNSSRTARQQHGLVRSLIANMVEGVTKGFEKRLEFKGVGYRANVEGGKLVMSLGFSHPVQYMPREGITLSVEKNMIIVSGIDKQLVGQTAAEIRSLKKPEPYKGKGISYEGERIRRKAGKTAVKSGA